MNEALTDLQQARSMALAAELRAVVGGLLRRLREQHRPGDLTWSQKSVLWHLEREGAASVTELARAEGVKPQSMGATVAALEAAGLVAGSPDPADGRRTILSLTESCRQMLAANRAAKQDWIYRALLARFTPAEQEEIARSLELLKRLADF
jgi:DNA-binding MarR family transcriptional regulator